MNPEGELFYHHQIEDQCEEQLNDCLESVKIGNLTYEAGHCLRFVDEIAFDQEVSAYLANLLGEYGWSEMYLTYDEITEHRHKVASGEWELEVNA